VRVCLAGYSFGPNGLDDGGGGDDIAVAPTCQQTAADGSYAFSGVLAGKYSVSKDHLLADSPGLAGFLDGKDTAGTNGGTVTNGHGTADDVISAIVTGVGQSVNGYNFGEILPASLAGTVFEDIGTTNGQLDPGEPGIGGVTVTLTGTDDLGSPVALTGTTTAAGAYLFDALRPGTYTITETQPVGFTDATPSVQIGSGAATPGTAGVDTVSTISLAAGNAATGYNFGELPPAQVGISKSTTATGAVPGGSIAYTVTATNSGAVAADGSNVTDAIAPGLTTPFTWTCGATGGAICPNVSGSGAINETIATFPVGASVTYAITATVAANPPTTVTNVATVSPPAGGSCADGSAPPCAASVDVAMQSQVGLTKTVAETVATPGQSLHWTLTATAGGVPANGSVVSDPLPAGIVSSTWTCTGTGGAVCPATSGSGAINQTIAIFPANASVSYAITGLVGPTPPSNIVNLATATPPAGGRCLPGNTPPPCSASTTTPSAAAVAVAKSVVDADGNGVADPGETLTYTVTLTNSGGSAASGFGLTDTLDPNTQFVSASNGGTEAAGVVSWTGLTVPANGSLTLNVVVTVADPIPAGVLTIDNLAYPTGQAPPDCTAQPRPGNCAVIPTAGDIGLVKRLVAESGTLPGIAEAGETLTYAIALDNTGGSDVTGYAVTDPLDANVTFVSADQGGVEAGGIVSWSGLAIPAHTTLTLTVVVTVASPIAPGVMQILNLAYETGTSPPACPPAGNQCVVIPTEAAVSVSKSVTDASGDGIADPGETLTYAIVLTNSGGSAASAVGLTDALDPNTTFVSADNGGAASGGSVTWSGLVVPAGGSLTLTVVVTVDDPLPAGVTQVVNLAYQSGQTPPDCSAFPQPANCAQLPTSGAVDITKRLSGESGSVAGIAEPGETLTYTITLANSGGSAVTGYAITDPLDPNVSFVSADNGGVASNGSVAWSGLTVPSNGSLVLTVVVRVADPIPAGVTQIVNVAVATGQTAPDCSATPLPSACAVVPTANAVSIAKAFNPETIAIGGTSRLTITLTNPNPNGATLTADLVDTLPANVVIATVPNFATTCSGLASAQPGSTMLTLLTGFQIVGGTPFGSCTASVDVTSNLPGHYVNVIPTGALQTDLGDNTAPATAPLDVLGSPALTVAKSVSDASGDGIAQAGETLTYTITVSNSGSSAATGFGITDALDPNTAFVSASDNGSEAGGVVSWSGLSVAAGSNISLTVVVLVHDPLPAGLTRIANLAYLGGQAPPDCNATPLPANCAVIPVVPASGTPQISVSKTANVGSAPAGGTVVYTITVRNVGSVPARDVAIADPLPAGIVAFAWSCAGSAVACPNASGSGAIDETVPVFGVGAQLVYTVTATLGSGTSATVVNRVAVTPTGDTVCAPGGGAPPCTAQVPVTVGPAQPPGKPTQVPVDSPLMLIVLGLMLGAVARAAAQRRRVG
jgi:uncharacterized repeat protein (TIGR01451 family)